MSATGPLLLIDDLPSGAPLTVENTDSSISTSAGIGENVVLSVPAMPAAYFLMLAVLALLGSALVLYRRGCA